MCDHKQRLSLHDDLTTLANDFLTPNTARKSEWGSTRSALLIWNYNPRSESHGPREVILAWMARPNLILVDIFTILSFHPVRQSERKEIICEYLFIDSSWEEYRVTGVSNSKRLNKDALDILPCFDIKPD